MLLESRIADMNTSTKFLVLSVQAEEMTHRTLFLRSLILLALSIVTVFRYHRVTGTDSSWIHFVEPVIYVREDDCLADDGG